MQIGNHKALTYDQKKMIVDIVNNGKGTLASKCSLIGISTTTYYNYKRYVRLAHNANNESNETINHLSNALDDIKRFQLLSTQTDMQISRSIKYLKGGKVAPPTNKFVGTRRLYFYGFKQEL